jgi:serine/threonine-protein kinase
MTTAERPAASALLAEELPGSVIAGTYRILRSIGAGGMSEVFAAEHVRLGTHVAVKVVRPGGADPAAVLARFRREVRAIARLRSEHVVAVHDAGELANGTPYLVMELLDGEDLRRMLQREGALPVRRAVALVLQVCAALRAVHAAGLVHRDLKPENLFISRRASGEDWCKVLDFGVAKMDDSHSTVQGAVIGTVRYMAPEQLMDAGAADVRTDIHALGAILYECLAGSPARDANSVHQLMFSVLNQEPAPLQELRPELPRELARAVMRALERQPAHRFQDVEAFADALTPYAGALRTGPVVTPLALEQEPTLEDSWASAETRQALLEPSGVRARERVSPWRARLLASVAGAALFLGGWWSRSLLGPGAESSLAPTAAEASASRPSAPSVLRGTPSEDVVRARGSGDEGSVGKAVTSSAAPSVSGNVTALAGSAVVPPRPLVRVPLSTPRGTRTPRPSGSALDFSNPYAN